MSAYHEGIAAARESGLPYTDDRNPHCAQGSLRSQRHFHDFRDGYLSVGNTCSHESYTTRKEGGDSVTRCDRCGKQVQRPACVDYDRPTMASVLHANRYLRDGRY